MTFRKIYERLLVLSILLISSGLAVANTQFTWKQGESNGYKYRYVENDPSATRYYTLPNGLTVILSAKHDEPRIQSYIAVKAGSKTDPANHTGLAHYLEHMLFKGTDQFGTLDYAKEKPLLDMIDDLYEEYNHSKDEEERTHIYSKIDSVSNEAAKFAIANEYDKLVASVGAKGSNAFTSFEQTVYLEDIPSNAIDKYLAIQAERFRNPVFRIFHTELEAVYEEKNISLDSDSRRLFESVFSNLFKKHNYGLQTPIGTIEHLKNPSLLEIRKYYNNYYVPNNMGIIMVGDFNIDEMIQKIDRSFGFMKAKPITPYTFEKEEVRSEPTYAEVVGPEPARVMIGYRLPGSGSKDAQLLELVGSILTNGTAGLIDLNLVQKQKLLAGYGFPYVLQDYSMLILLGMPTEGQSLEEVKDLLISQIDALKKGNFSNSLIQSISNNTKKENLQVFDSYSSLANTLMDNFTTGIDWASQLQFDENITKITKQDIVDFANKYFNDDYVTVYKRQGENPDKTQVEKPNITPVAVNREAQSDFFKEIAAMPENQISPQWIDYHKDIQRGKAGKYELLSVENKNNDLFNLYFHYETGSYADLVLSYAAEYLTYLGTKDKSAAAIKEEFYRLASNYGVSVSNEESYIYLSGLQENFDATLKLFNEWIKEAVADEDALEAYKARIIQSRVNKKEDKGNIMRGLNAYAQYGAVNPFNYDLSTEEIRNLTSEALLNAVRLLLDYPHKVLYYGPESNKKIGKLIAKQHKAPKKFKSLPALKEFKQLDIKENKVYFAKYPMVQAEVSFVRNAGLYNEATVPNAQLFNEYFGGGMGSIVFQSIRESKALAYSTYAFYSNASKPTRENTVIAYVGTQADKFVSAVDAMHELFEELPSSQKGFQTAQNSIIRKMETDRIIKQNILFSYLTAQKMGRDYDLRMKIHDTVPGLTFNDLIKFHEQNFKNKPFVYCIVADDEVLSKETMKKYGPVTELTLEQIFGY